MIGSPTIRWPDRLLSLTVLRFILWITFATLSHDGVLSDPFKLA